MNPHPSSTNRTAAPAAADAPPDAPPRTVGQVDTEVRKLLKDDQQSALRKYAWLTVGRPGLWALARYELLTSLLGSLPGAMGIALRQKFYRRLFGRCGRGVVIGRNVTIRHPHRIALGDGVIIDDNCVLDAKGEADRTLTIGSHTILGRNTILSCKGGVIELGERVNISVNCTLISETRLRIGDKTLIAGHCYLIAGGNHGLDRTDVPVCEQPCIQKGGIDIAPHCWLGAGVTVLDGVTIGRDSVVAAGAVVHRPLPAFVIAGGVPAKILRQRLGQQPAADAQPPTTP